MINTQFKNNKKIAKSKYGTKDIAKFQKYSKNKVKYK